jgi:TRAP-type C4-dicarboxylate transport system permease small subunit
MSRAIRWLDLALQIVTLTLLVALAAVVLLGVSFRYSGASLIWYDEVASMLLAWITFSGAGLATLRDAHLGFGGLLFGAPRPVRVALLIVVEAIFLASFLIIGWAGWAVLAFLAGDTLVSVRFAPRDLVQAILPVGAAVVILARLLTLPHRARAVLAGADPERAEIAREIGRAAQETGR